VVISLHHAGFYAADNAAGQIQPLVFELASHLKNCGQKIAMKNP
jgi:hypothetical protein